MPMPGENVSRALACIRPTIAIHDAVEIRFYWELRGVLLMGDSETLSAGEGDAQLF